MTGDTPVHAVCKDDAHLSGLLGAIEGLNALLAMPSTPVKAIRNANKGTDATGVYFSNNTRIVHRVSGLSKAAPPPDPFRRGSRGPAIRDADDNHRGDPKANRWREIQSVDANGHETSIRMFGRKSGVIEPDHIDPVHAMRIQLAILQETLRHAVPQRSNLLAERIAGYAACMLLDIEDLEIIRGTAVTCIMPSILGGEGFRFSGIDEADVGALRAAMADLDNGHWPCAVAVGRHAETGSSSWIVAPYTTTMRPKLLDPLERMRIIAAGNPLSGDRP